MTLPIGPTRVAFASFTYTYRDLLNIPVLSLAAGVYILLAFRDCVAGIARRKAKNI